MYLYKYFITNRVQNYLCLNYEANNRIIHRREYQHTQCKLQTTFKFMKTSETPNTHNITYINIQKKTWKIKEISITLKTDIISKRQRTCIKKQRCSGKLLGAYTMMRKK